MPALSRTFRLTGRLELQALAEGFNLTNRHERPHAEHQLRARGVPDEPLCRRSDSSRPSVNPDRSSSDCGSAFESESMMRVGVAVRTGAVVLASVATLGLALRAAPPTGATSLAIAGRSNATPWVASDGPLVAVVWGASVADKTDVFLAVSHDSGQTFGAPVQVNTIPGEARLGGELPPRVAVTAGREPYDR